MQVTERRSGNLKGLGALGRRDLRSEQRDRLLAVARAIEGLTRPKLIHPLRESRRAPVGQGRLSMKRTRHTPEQVINKLREAETMLAGSRTVAQLLQHLGVSEATFNRWRNQYGGMKSEDAKRKELEIENARLKRLVAEKELDIAILRQANDDLGKPRAPRGGGRS